VTAGGHADLPVVVSLDAHDFLATPALLRPGCGSRFVSVLDSIAAVVMPAIDTRTAICNLRRYTTLPFMTSSVSRGHPPSSLFQRGRFWGRLVPGRLKGWIQAANVSVRPREMNDYFHRVVLVTR